MSTETKLCCGPRFGVFVDGKCVTCGAPEDTESIPEIMDRHYAQQRRDQINMRDVFKSMRRAVNAIDDGLPRLAQEILGDALRQYGEEQPS